MGIKGKHEYILLYLKELCIILSTLIQIESLVSTIIKRNKSYTKRFIHEEVKFP